MSSDENSVVTVTGRIPPNELGRTLTHEHLFTDFVEAWYNSPDSAYERKLARQPISIENLGYIRQNMMKVKDNLRLDSLSDAVDEVEKYRQAGGDSLVDLTPKNTGGDPRRVRSVSRQTGVTIIHGTGYYTRTTHPKRLNEMEVDELEQEFVQDVVHGIGDTDVRAGIIGELGVSDTIHAAEERVLRAGARAALRTGAPLNVHPPGGKPKRDIDNTIDGIIARSRWALELLDIIETEGLHPERVVVSHVDGSLFENIEFHREIATRGAFVEFDLWGALEYFAAYNDGMPADSWRLEMVTTLIDDGFLDQLLFSSDVAFKSRLTKYGGYGYEHIPRNVVPMLEARGVTPDQIKQILIENPARMLTFEAPE